jgi:hypothetical protein
MPRACIFCGASAGSAEHLFPNWLNGVLPPPPTGTADYERRQASDSGVETRSWSIARAASETTNWVCHRCNTGWMSRLVSPATVDDHEGDTVGEHEFVNMLSPWWSL